MNFSRFEPKEFIAIGHKVVALGHSHGNHAGRQNFDSDFAMVFTLRNGKVIEFQEFMESAAINAAYTVGATVNQEPAAPRCSCPRLDQPAR